ncbi:MAG TPA: penicillin-binding protein 2, partial [Alphaproteobacteria bacterium]|nr:penicillin-binding protein 2 [Alphaproteobacteria bacterium]
LAEALPELGHEDLVGKLSGERRFIWLKRHLTPRQQYDINRLGLPGIGFVEDERRVYPQGPLFAHALGYTGIDNHGLAGLERALDERLAAPERGERPEPLVLSLDLRVQHALREELVRSVETFRALGAAGLVLDVDTGEILALVSLPDFDPNLPDAPTGEAMFNRATLGVYEMGSTFKIFTVAMALDSGSVTIDGGYDASQPIAASGYVITDYHPQSRFLTVPEIMVHSSNIGAAKMALDLGAARQKEYLHRFGLLTAARIELPEVGLPLAPETWRDINTMTIAFGHGVAVSPLQLANAAAAIVNGGVLRPATLIKRADEGPVPGVQVISAETSRTMRWLMRLVVEQGTGRNAEASGYFVGGKTGTAEKAIAGHYQKSALLSTFVGAFPMRKPRYVVLITLDEPKGTPETFGFATAGWTAAPTASRLITRLGPLLGIEPMAPLAPAANGTLVQHEEGRLELASF